VTPNAKVSVYYFEKSLSSWVLWNGTAYGQVNPQIADNEGSYSFILPTGKYFVKIQKAGFKTANSEIFTLSGTNLINFNFNLRNLKKIVIGPISFFSPSFTPPSSFKVNLGTIIDTSRTNQLIGKIVPEILIGKNKSVDVSSYVGKTTLISFISTWSNNALDQISRLEKLSTDNSNNIIVVFLQDSSTQVVNFITRGKYTFNYLVDKDGYSAEKFGIISLPQSFLIDKNWKIKNVYYDSIPNSLN
jgi:peroxiredoxin